MLSSMPARREISNLISCRNANNSVLNTKPLVPITVVEITKRITKTGSTYYISEDENEYQR